MDIQSLLCSQQTITADEVLFKSTAATTPRNHVRTASWSSASCASSPDSPATASSAYYSIPSSPELDTTPSSPLSMNMVDPSHVMQHQRNADKYCRVSTSSSPPAQHVQTRTPWSVEEDQLLQQGYSQGLSWAMISTVYLPHRSRGCCWGRFKTLRSKALEQKEWTESEDRLLLLAIKKNARLFKQAWKAVAQDMGNRNWKECESRSLKIGNSGLIRKKQYQPQHQHRQRQQLRQ